MKKKILIIGLIVIILIAAVLISFVFVNNKKDSNDYLSFIEFNEKENCYVYIDKYANIKKINKDKYELSTSSDFVDNCMIVKDENSKEIVIDSDQNIILDSSYGVENKNGKFFRTYKDGKYGVIDKDKNVIVPNEYEFIRILTYKGEQYKNFCIVLAEKSDDTYDMYTNIYGKILSNFKCETGLTGGVSYYGIDEINAGIIKYNNENYDQVYVSSKNGKELAIQTKDATKTVDLRKNCIITEEKGSEVKNVQIFDNKLNLTNKIETEGTIKSVPGYIIITETKNKTTVTNVYDMNGKVVFTSDKELWGKYSDNGDICFYGMGKIYNSKFKEIYELKTNDKISSYDENEEFIYIENNKKITAYNYDGTVALEDIDKKDYHYVVKGNENYVICGNKFVKARDGSELGTYPVTELQEGSDKYMIKYNDGFQIYDKKSNSIVWDYKGDEKDPKNLEGVYALKLGNSYYNYYGKKIYEIKN